MTTPPPPDPSALYAYYSGQKTETLEQNKKNLKRSLGSRKHRQVGMRIHFKPIL